MLSSTFGLLASSMFKDDDPPNEEALALAPAVGWLFLVGVVAFIALFILHREAWRRWWLTVEDPRTIALYRIVFGFFVICNMNDFFEYFTFLFTDEGIFTADVAREVHAKHQFEGFGDGFAEDDPWGFFDAWAVLRFLEGPKYSLLYIWDTPAFFWAHMIAFYLAAAAFVIGFRTRAAGVLTFFLMNSVFFRNHLFWEGTELVYRVFLAYLVCAKAGHAYSVDNWLRCRRLRKQGRLSEPGGPGGGAGVAPSKEHPRGLEAVYRAIPAWPRRLAMLQLCTVYATTGILKNGSVWAKGDAIYYAWSMDHFYRFYPQQIAALLGTNVLRIMTWVTHWGEALFFVIMFGLLTRFAVQEKIPPLRGLRAMLSRLCLLTIIAVSSAVIWVTWTVHFTPAISRSVLDPEVARQLGDDKLALYDASVFVGGWTLLMLGFWALWTRLGRKPFQIRGRRGLVVLYASFVALADVFLALLLYPLMSTRDALLPVNVAKRVGIVLAFTVVAGAVPFVLRSIPAVRARLGRLPVFQSEFLERRHVIDREWFARWVFGRRIWIVWHIGVMGGIFVLMNIGQFQTGMLSQGILFFTGAEVAWFLHTAGWKLGFRRHAAPIPGEDLTLPHLHRDAVRLPQWAMFIGLAVFLAGVLARVDIAYHREHEFEWRWIWVAGFAFMAGVMTWQWWSNRGVQLSLENPATGKPRVPWAYGPFGRFVVNALLVWHIIGVAVWLLPDKDSLSPWKGEARKVWSKWLTTTQTDQGWGMFAPNPPRSNVFLKVLVTDDAGEVYDLKTDVYAPERKPIPWIWNDRMRKMNRRIIGGESGNTQWYRKWYARYICRDWGMQHEGIEPKKVDLVKVWYRIPSPEETYRRGYYSPEDLLARTGAEKIEHTEHCRSTVMGQIAPWIRERHDLPPLRDGWKYRPWLKHKQRKWERIMEKWRGEDAAKAAEDEPAEAKTDAPTNGAARSKDAVKAKAAEAKAAGASKTAEGEPKAEGEPHVEGDEPSG